MALESRTANARIEIESVEDFGEVTRQHEDPQATVGVTDNPSSRKPGGFWVGKRAIVAGGTGFLGRRMAERLHTLGASVTSCSRKGGCDLRDRTQAERFFADARPEVVFNFAANQGGVRYQELCPASILHDNLLIAINTMEAARVAGAARYVNIVAACAYPGEPVGGLLREDEIEAGPMHPSADNYGIVKRVALMQAKHYRRQYGLASSSICLANSYGPRDHFHPDRSHALAALVRRFYEAKRDCLPEVVIWGRGIAERDWLFADDAITGILLTLERCPDVPLINIGNGRGWTIAELSEIICDEVGYEGTLAYDASKPEGPLKKTMDTCRMHELLDWTPPTSLRCGVRETVIWFDANYLDAIHGN